MDNELIKQCTAEAQKWLSPAFDAETQAEVKAMLDAEDKTALIDAFYQNLEFGTGGLRGIMGAGTNRMNKWLCQLYQQGIRWQEGHQCGGGSRLPQQLSSVC